jgi:hypothetical protein
VLVIKNTAALGNGARTLAQQLKQLPGVENASLTAYTPTSNIFGITAYFPKATVSTNSSMLTQYRPVDDAYIKPLCHCFNGRKLSVHQGVAGQCCEIIKSRITVFNTL